MPWRWKARTPTPCDASWPTSEVAARTAAPVPGRSPARTLGKALAAGLMLFGCARTVTPPRPLPEEGHRGAGLELPGAELATQRLFRVRYDGPEGEGGLRLVLRLAGVGRYTVQTSDRLGRSLWSLEVAAEGHLLVDHRGETFCRAPGEVTLPEVALAPLPLRSIPRVLLGYSPVVGGREPPASGAGDEVVDPEGRRWTLVRGEEGLKSWTLWSAGEPLVWWLRQPGGGILSHREGVQFRWRQVVREPLEGPLQGVVVPPGYRETVCRGAAIGQAPEDGI